MLEKDKKPAAKQPEQPVKTERKPNEQAGFHLSSSIKITDPNTGQVILQMRAD
jgi:hypothetical protein